MGNAPTSPLVCLGEQTAAQEQVSPLLAGQVVPRRKPRVWGMSSALVRDRVREPAPAEQLRANGPSWWLGLSREQFSRAVARREHRDVSGRRVHEAACRRFLRQHHVERIPVADPPAAPAWLVRRHLEY